MVLPRGQVRDYPLTLRRRSGATTDVLFNATPYTNETGQVQGVFTAARDITERKRAEEMTGQTNIEPERRVCLRKIPSPHPA